MGGKSKGSAFEREICKMLNVWLTGKEKPYVFWRSPSSGALATIHVENEDMSGDITGFSEEAKIICSVLNFELKTGYKETSIDKFLKYNKTDKLKEFWNQCINDCNDKKHPVLIYRKKGLNTPWVCIDNSLFNVLYRKLKNYRYIILHFRELRDMYIFELKEFFDAVKPNDIKEIAKWLV